MREPEVETSPGAVRGLWLGCAALALLVAAPGCGRPRPEGPNLLFIVTDDQRYEYARDFEQDPVYEELYDLDEDPSEARNVAGEAAHAELLQSMRERCDELRDGYGGPWVGVPAEDFQ